MALECGIVDLPDERLDFLASIHNPKKKTPASVKFVDIAGLIKGASNGEGLGNKFLANIRLNSPFNSFHLPFSDVLPLSDPSKHGIVP